MTEHNIELSEFDTPACGAGPSGTLEILAKLPLARADIGYIGKNQDRRSGDSGGGKVMYTFRGIDDVLTFIGPVFVKHGITPVPQFCRHHVEVLNVKGANGDRSMTVATVTLKLYLYATDGSWVCCVANGEGREYGDDKSTAKAQSMAYKIASFLGLMVPITPDGLEDGDRDPEPGQDGKAGRAQSVTGGGNAGGKQEEGAAQSERYSRARAAIVKAGGDVKKLKKLAAAVEEDAQFTPQERAALHRLINLGINNAADSAESKGS